MDPNIDVASEKQVLAKERGIFLDYGRITLHEL